MENEKSLVRTSDVRLPKFVEDAYDSIEGMKQFADMLLESKLVPDSYYEKGPDRKPDYTKGKTSAVVIVLLQAQQLAVPPMTGLQHIVPVNGLLSIKGDLAKTMIFASGKLKKGSWIETVTGSIEKEDMVVSITATREDNGTTLTRTFSVDKAKRMGLWVTSAQANGQDGWKWQKSAWYKTPDRMLNYRALGNIARDLFSDVLLNMYTTEEAVDIGKDVTEIIESESGAKITIPDKEHAKTHSAKMTSKVADKIPDNKFGEVKKDNIQEAEVINDDQEKEKIIANLPTKVDGEGAQAFIARYNNYINSALAKYPDIGFTHLKPDSEQKSENTDTPQRGSVEVMNGKEIDRGGSEPEASQQANDDTEGKLTLEGMEKMETSDLLKIINEDMDMMEAVEMIEGKNTNKKLRLIIFAHQNDTLAEYVAENMPAKADDTEENKTTEEAKQGEISINKEFDNQGPEQPAGEPTGNADILQAEKKSGNKYNLEIPDVGEQGNRDFSSTKTLFNALAGVSPSITAPRYLELAAKLGIGEKYQDKEVFCRGASVELINQLLNSN